MKSKPFPYLAAVSVYTDTRPTQLDEAIPDCIRRRAYELWEEGGRKSGHELDDWLKAERDIKHHFGLS